MSTAPTLRGLRSDFTQTLILGAAIEILEKDASVTELTVRAIARQASASERTIFRYFPAREQLLDAVAEEMARRLDTPPVPATVEELREYPRALYACFEDKAALTKAALHSELFGRMRDTVASDRWKAVRTLLDGWAPQRPEKQRRIAAANIRYFLAATAWYYYRFYFKFSLEDTINCARSNISLVIDSLKNTAKGSS